MVSVSSPGGKAFASTTDKVIYVSVRGNDANDGLTPKSAKATVTAAIALMNDGNGGTIDIGNGTLSSGAIDLSAGGIKLRGSGMRSTVIDIKNVVGNAITLGPDCTISDLRLKGNVSANSVGIGTSSGAYHWSVNQVWISAFHTCVNLNYTWAGAFYDTIIQSCIYGFRISGTQVNAVYYFGGEIQGCTTAAVFADSSISSKVGFYGVTIESNGYGVYMPTGCGLFGFSFNGCYFESNTTGHIHAEGLTRALGIISCTFLGNTAFSVRLDLGADPVIDNCIFLANNGSSIIIGASVLRALLQKNWYTGGQEYDVTTAPAGTTIIDRSIVLPTLRLPHSAAPVTPVNGDIWTTTAGLFVRINGVTVGPLT